jgi:hypothetical protein
MKKDERWRTTGASAADEQSRTFSFDTLVHEFLEHFRTPWGNQLSFSISDQFKKTIRKN